MKLEILSKTDNFNIQKDIISKIRDLINSKNLESGDRLPSERVLSDKFEVKRSNIRIAIKKLEFYGLLETIPQSGTFIANIGTIALNGIIEHILTLEDPDFKALVETRILFELKIAEKAALRRTDKDLEDINIALLAYQNKVLKKEDAVQEDLLFHLAIAKASGNSAMNSFMLMITPEIITNFKKHHICDVNLAKSGIKEHQAIFDAIKNQDSNLAKEKMKVHFKVLYQYCYNIK